MTIVNCLVNSTPERRETIERSAHGTTLPEASGEWSGVVLTQLDKYPLFCRFMKNLL